MPSGGATLSVSDANFDQEVLKSTEPVVVDFFAEWCGPCKAMAPALDAVATELKGKVKIAKLDVDQNPAVTQKYAIQAMPTMMIFKGGKLVVHNGLKPTRTITIRAEADTVMSLSNLKIGPLGMPVYYDGVGRGVATKLLRGKLKIDGLLPNLLTLNAVTRVFSVQ